MRRAVFNLEPFDWAVEVCIAIRKLDGGYVLSRLSELGASRKVMLSAADLIDSWSPNKGLTYSNKHTKESIVVVGITSSPAEFQNSLQHELRHLCNDIAMAFKLDWRSEKVAYLVGDINAVIFPFVHDLLCPKCRARQK